MSERCIAYYRVSTERQGRSGLGLDAQRAAVLAHLRGVPPAAEYTEVESGKNNARPQLGAAIQECRLTGATLVIAKLDRLSRNAAFLLTLRDSGVNFVAADVPDANALTVGILALIAQHEREAISQRTKAALQAAKRRGRTLGNPNGAAALRRAGKGNAAALDTIRRRSDEHARRVLPVLADLRLGGAASLSAQAAGLNARGIKTARGGRWHASTVKALLKRS